MHAACFTQVQVAEGLQKGKAHFLPLTLLAMISSTLKMAPFTKLFRLLTIVSCT